MKLALLSALAFVGTVFAANWAINAYGPVSVGFGLMAPAGVYFAGLAFVLRDTTQRLGGKPLALAAIAIGAGCSALVDTRLALASGAAFLASEVLDFSVFTALREGLPASIASNVAGAFLDSFLFLTLAGFGLAFFWGQVVGKLWITAPVVLALVIFRARKRVATA